MQVELADVAGQHVADGQIEKAPQHVDRRRRQAFTGRTRERALKRPPHHSADEVRDRVGEESAAEKIGKVMKPGHRVALLVSRRSTISAVVPVSPSFGKMRVMLLVWTSVFLSVMA